MTQRLRRVLESGGRGTMVSLHTSGAKLAELTGALDVDGVFVDMQHGAFDVAGAAAIITSLSGSDATPVVRVAGNDANTIGRILDAGARGIVCPLIETADEAARLVDACRRTPEEAAVLAIALVESRLGYENIEQICATRGLDAIMVGSADLAASMDGTLAFDESRPEVVERRDRMIAVAHEHGIWALASASVNGAADPFDSGADFLVISDNSVLGPVLKKAASVLREPRPVAAPA